MNRKFIVQVFKYGIVGVLNTLLTAVVIWVMMHFVFQVKGERDASSMVISVSNITGYVSGFINSFIWNRKWTFHSRKNWKIDFLRFVGAFLICYIPQLLLVMLLNSYANISPLKLHALGFESLMSSAYLCQLIGMVFYTALNFLCNKYYTFKA
ncbi:cell wall teichoic acid glycosylation protein GtcA [Bacteroidia bacterium]|nr:cell wall teichoic acid glycosylation protein GtcA [Bacteroidia bacterium]